MNVEDLVDVPEQEYSLYLTDHKAEGTSYGADMARDADYRYQTEKDSTPKSQFFGKVKSPIKETTYLGGFLRANARFAVEAPTGIISGLSRVGQEAIVQPVLNLYDMAGWYSLDSELNEYKDSVGFDNMSPKDKVNFMKTDERYLDIQRRMNEKSSQISMREDPKFEAATNELWQNYKKQIAQFEETVGINAKETDSNIVNMFGNGSASLLEAAAIVAVTKNPVAAAYVFGVQQGSGLYEEARENGVDVVPALGLATAGGIVEGLLEEWGLHKIADNIVTNTWAKAAAKSFLTESIQEGSQQTAEEAIMYKIRNDETWKDKVIRVFQSMAIGGILGSVGTIAARPFVLQHAKTVHNELVQNGVDEARATELVNQAVNGTEKQKETASHDIQVALGAAQFQQSGLSPEESQSLAENLAVPTEDMKNEIVDSLKAELDPVTYEGGTIESGVKFFDDNIDKSLLAEDFDIAEQVRAEAVEGGMNEEQANLVATAVDSFAKVMYNKTGITPRENWENGTLHTMIKDERPRIEEMQDVTQTEEEKTKWDDGSYVGEDGLIHDKDGKVLFQKGEDTKDLVVYHNISKESLEKAMKLGGLPVPSLAITRKDIPFGRFGEISLVGNKGIIDPSNYKNEVYNRDVWSATFPKTEYRKPKDSDIKKFKNKFGKFFDKAGDTAALPSFVYSLTFSPARAENEIANSLGMKLAYIETELGKDVEIPKKDFGESILKENRIDEQFVEDLKNVDMNGDNKKIRQEVTKAYLKMLDRKDYSEFGRFAEKMKNIEKTGDGVFDKEDGLMYFNKADTLLYAAKNYVREQGKSVIDDTALRQKIDGMIKDKQAYREWSRNTLEYELLGEPKIEVGRSLKDMTLQNIVDAMTLGETKNAQDSFVYGTGKVIAAGAKKLESIADIKLESGKFVSEEEEKAIHEKLTEDITSFSSRILKVAGISFDFNAMSAAHAALGHIATLKNPTVDSLQKALNKEMGEKRVYPRYILEEGVRIAEEVKGLARHYFEAKPQRAVMLNEFSGAIVPTDTKYDDISQKLQEQGLKVVRSDNQLEAVKEFEDVFFQDESSPRGLYKHSMNNKILEILKNGDASTVIHELGHYFTINYLEALQNAGQEEEARAVLDWLGVNSISDLMADTQQATDALEKLARGFETYVMTEEAPSSRLKEFFERFKNWLIDIYHSLAPEQINDGVRDFFDKMIAMDEEDFTDVMRLAEKKQDVREVMRQALAGKAVEINGIKIDDIKTLVKAINARIPKKAPTLVDYLKQVGINEEFARSMDLHHTLGVADLIADDETLKQLKKKKLVTQKDINEARKLITKEGGISREDELIDFLHGLGLMQESGETYEDTSALWDKAMSILENAENTYAEQDVAKAEKRQAIMDSIEQAEEMLSGMDYNAIVNALKTLAKEDTVGVKKETLKYIKDKQREIESGYKKLLKQMLKAQKKDMQQVRDAVVDYIKDQPILAEDKTKLLNFIKKANSMNTLQKVAEQIKDKAMEYYDKEQRKELSSAIQKELKHTKPYSGGEQRYDYENNKLFKDLRDYNKLTKAAAGEELAKLPMEEAALEDLTETDLIKRRFLSYKAGGADASSELLNQVLNDIVNAKEKGKLAKSEEEHENMVNMENDRKELINVLDESKADPKEVGQIIQNKYRTWITSLYSMLNSIFGKGIADKYQLETKQTNVEARVWQKTTDVINNVAKILGVKGRTGVLDEFSKMAQNKQTITDSEGVTTEVDTFGIIDMYNAIKNEKTKQDYYAAFGEGQVNSLINTLTVQERAFGDYLMQEVNSYYKKLNDVYVKLYGIDLPKVDNYWMATSEHKDSIDIQGDYFNQTTIPSALKERSKGRVVPIPKNAWQKFNKHIAEAEYISGLGLDYMNIKKIFKSRRIKSKITEKYGDAVYRAIMDDIESLSMAKKIQEIDEVNNTFQKILGNTVLAKIAVGIPVFVKQLASVTNYAVDMPTGLWAKGFAEGLSHPKETVKYMMENAPFLKARLGKGYNEALERVIRDANKMSGKKVKWAEAMSSFTRYGDIGAIIFGGYPYMKYLQNTGVENAAEKFEFSTLRSQQSGTPVSLSPFQRSRGMMQIFQAFNNTPTQYMRMIFDSIYQYKNGDITAQQMAKSLFNFGIIQPILYVLAGEYAGKLLFWGDDDKEEESVLPKILRQILINPIDGIPVFSDFIGAMFDRAAGDKNFGMKPVLISDIDKAFSKLNKKELDAWDISEILTPFVEAMTAAPMGRFERILKKNFKD